MYYATDVALCVYTLFYRNQAQMLAYKYACILACKPVCGPCCKGRNQTHVLGQKPKRQCLHQVGEEDATDPLLSAKLHKSWIADVQLLPAEQFSLYGDSKAAALSRMLTASNDGSVRLWDLGKCCGALPLELAQADDLHTGKPPGVHVSSSHVFILAARLHFTNSSG